MQFEDVPGGAWYAEAVRWAASERIVSGVGSGYALDALRWAVEQGIVSGKSGGVLAPKGLATRAQTAQMLINFLIKGGKGFACAGGHLYQRSYLSLRKQIGWSKLP